MFGIFKLVVSWVTHLVYLMLRHIQSLLFNKQIYIHTSQVFTGIPPVYLLTPGANQEEDLQDLIKKGYIKPSSGTLEDFEEDEEGNREIESKTIDRGKIAYAIGTFQKTMNIAPPDINVSGFGIYARQK